MPSANKAEERRSWDWTQQDITLAERHGVSRERVRQIRAEIGADKSYNKRRKRKAVQCGNVVV